MTLQPVKGGAPVGRLRNVVLPNGQTLGTGGGTAAPRPAAAARASNRVASDPRFVSR